MKTIRPYPRLIITKKGTAWTAEGHPWIYGAEVIRAESPEGTPLEMEFGKGTEDGSYLENGCLADAVSESGKYIGTGLVSLRSKIRLRLLSRNANDRFDEAFFRRRIRYALDYRKTVMGEDIRASRLIFGEADSFPGLTVDRFENLLSVQILSYGLELRKELLYRLLLEELRKDGVRIDGIFERNDVSLRELEGLREAKGWYPIPGCETPESAVTEILENGIRYNVDVENGQKTGFFLDQKYNRLAVARLAQGKTVLDCFTHTGSFALNAAKGNAKHVTAVDISESALELARANAKLNGLESRMDFICADFGLFTTFQGFGAREIEASAALLSSLSGKASEIAALCPDCLIHQTIWCRESRGAYLDFLADFGFRERRALLRLRRSLYGEAASGAELPEPLPPGLYFHEPDLQAPALMDRYILGNGLGFGYPDSRGNMLFRMKALGARALTVTDGCRTLASVTLFPDGAEAAATEDIFCVPDFRRQGLATQLIKEAFRRLRQEGFREVHLNVYEDNAPALTLYRSLGYTEAERILELWG